MENEENKTGAENSTQGSQEKMFTQEEVNTIIQNRLTREKEKSATENAAALADREAQLQERELKLQLREEMANHDIPKELSDIITVTDEKSISTAIKLLEKYIRKPEKGTNSGCYRSTGTGRKKQQNRRPIQGSYGLKVRQKEGLKWRLI